MIETIKKYYKYPLTTLIVIFCAVAYFFSMKCLIQSSTDILSGGAAGIALIISRLVTADTEAQSRLFSIIYFGINVPLFLLSFKYIGKKFTIFSIFNVVLSLTLIYIIPIDKILSMPIGLKCDEVVTLASWVENADSLIIAITAGVIGGISTGLAFKFNFSGGGMDFVVLYLAIRKGINSGRYFKIINVGIVVVGGIVLRQYIAILFTTIYIFTNAIIVDAIHIKNQKMILHVVTTMADDITESFKKSSFHGCTILNGKGGYAGLDKQLMFMVISTFEVDSFFRKIKQIDPNSFVTVSTASLVTGRFYIPPLD
jgi:uncharacterized membrane-anchored protein YitT (DUF2179 family)